MITSFTPELLESELEAEQSFLALRPVVGQFILQLWRDLATQGHTQLQYRNSDSGSDYLIPSKLNVLDRWYVFTEDPVNQWIDIFSIDQWANKTESFDTEYAEEVATSNVEFFDLYEDYVHDEEFSEHVLGYAIANGLATGDLQVLEQKTFHDYLKIIYDERVFYKVDLEIFGDVRWDGARYRELSTEQQMSLAVNVTNSLKCSQRDWVNVIAPHIMICMARHDATVGAVGEFLLQNLPN